MTFEGLAEKFKEADTSNTANSDWAAGVDKFAEWLQKYFQENPPVAVSYEDGFALTLQNGAQFELYSMNEARGTIAGAGAVAVTSTRNERNPGGRKAMNVDPNSVQVSTGELGTAKRQDV